ncbi:hypothetical protein BGX34_008432 [Mortierella sp. NVP85]|nr:hypothetical protein BGX34_008432 [Mortierella sp. NVP85]
MSQSLSPELRSSKTKGSSSTGLRNLKRGFSEFSTAIKSVRKKVSSPSRRSEVKIRRKEDVITEVAEILQEAHSSACETSDEETFIAGSRTPPAAWSNWAENQTANPAQIFYPETIEDLTQIIHQAKTNNKKLRCACMGHTWSSSSVVQEEGYLAIMNKMEKMYAPVQLEENVWTVEIETGVLIKDLDDFLRKHDPPLTLPSNVVLDTVRYGGVLSLGCHGAATHTRTLPDLVHSVKILDSNGNVNVFSKDADPVEFSAATVNLGLLGIIYSYTLRAEPMFKLRVTDTFPLFNDYFSSPELDGPKLKAMVEGNDQTEIFYWPFNTAGLGIANDRLWVKQWQRVEDVPVTESRKHRVFQQALQNLETSFGSKLYEYMAANPSSTPFLCCLMYSALRKVGSDPTLVATAQGAEEGDEEVLYAPDAIHFQAGIDNMKCLDLEMAFKVDENFENVVKAWTYVTDQMYLYAERGEFPLNLTMEMRFVKASQMMMSNAYDDDPEAIYCMIEILSVADTQGFEEFSAKVAKYWMDEFQARPHWAKMWEHIPGIVPYLQEIGGARTRLDEFERIRKKYDPEGMFMNKTFAGLLGH